VNRALANDGLRWDDDVEAVDGGGGVPADENAPLDVTVDVEGEGGREEGGGALSDEPIDPSRAARHGVTARSGVRVSLLPLAQFPRDCQGERVVPRRRRRLVLEIERGAISRARGARTRGTSGGRLGLRREREEARATAKINGTVSFARRETESRVETAARAARRPETGMG
jgi:hypothetical protein